MKRLLLRTLIALSLWSFISCGPEEPTRPAILAVATIYGLSDGDLSEMEMGTATFRQEDSIVTVQINLIGLTPNNRHAVHIHEGTCESPGMHWNQGGQASFCREPNLGLDDFWAKPKAGDIGNIRADDNGVGNFELSTRFWRLGSGDPLDITNKVIMVHANEEDFAQSCFQTDGHMHNNNDKIACGVIQLITND